MTEYIHHALYTYRNVKRSDVQCNARKLITENPLGNEQHVNTLDSTILQHKVISNGYLRSRRLYNVRHITAHWGIVLMTDVSIVDST